MGSVQKARRCDQRRHQLASDHLVGRHTSCDLVLDSPGVSARHASIRWERAWILRDLGSKNGTSVNGERLGSTEARRLIQGDRIEFADKNDEWALVDDEAPRPFLVERCTNASAIALLDHEFALNLVPTPEHPFGTIAQRDRKWSLERLDGRIQTLENGQEIELGGRRYRLSLPEGIVTTSNVDGSASRRVEAGRYEFFVAADEESAALKVTFRDFERILEPRAHLYVLAYLARRRLEDSTTKGKSEDAAGWVHVEEACSNLGQSNREHLEVSVHRARKHFTDTGVANPRDIVDRRRRGHLRIGVPSTRMSVQEL